MRNKVTGNDARLCSFTPSMPCFRVPSPRLFPIPVHDLPTKSFSLPYFYAAIADHGSERVPFQTSVSVQFDEKDCPSAMNFGSFLAKLALIFSPLFGGGGDLYRHASCPSNTTAGVPFTVLVEGNVGSGKSTLLSAFSNSSLSDDGSVILVPEPVDKWQDVNGTDLLGKVGARKLNKLSFLLFYSMCIKKKKKKQGG